MAKTVSRKVNKKIAAKPSTDASLEIKTPYPEGEKDKNTYQKHYESLGKLPSLKSDPAESLLHWGEKMVKLQDRVNELELSLNEMNNKLKVVTGRMGL
jgi:hypothetical protein|tara:strand:+ start:58 stop:351 length:294 start_codon:yes stop_codon:yes gene_type:complete